MNLLDPGETPNENIQFLLVLACVIKAVDTHADLLRRSASNVGNDLRLGASEAPPAIVSVAAGGCGKTACGNRRSPFLPGGFYVTYRRFHCA